MKRTTTLLSVLALLLVLSVPAVADEHTPLDHPHVHALLIGADVDWVGGSPPYVINDYRRCQELAGGKALKHNRFHQNIHFGQAGVALDRAGHLVIPLSVFGFDSCDQFDAFFDAVGSFPPPGPPE
jgi:hypothetical protein